MTVRIEAGEWGYRRSLLGPSMGNVYFGCPFCDAPLRVFAGPLMTSDGMSLFPVTCCGSEIYPLFMGWRERQALELLTGAPPPPGPFVTTTGAETFAARPGPAMCQADGAGE